MNRSRMIWWLAGVAALGIAGTCIWASRSPRPPLPKAAHNDNLPDAFNQALAAARNRVRSRGFDPDTVRALARLYQANRLFREARACYQTVASVAALTARDHYYLAQIAQADGDLDGAQRELRAVLGLEPKYLPAALGLAAVLAKAGQDDSAAKEYGLIVAAEPDQPQASYGLAQIELHAGNDAAAVPRLEHLLARHPEATPAAALLAQVMDRRGETSRAAALTLWSRQRPEPLPPDPWLDALEADCYDLQSLGLRFEQYFATGQIAQAVPFLDRVAELDPRSPIPQLLRGWTAARDHDDAAAVSAYRQALAKGGDPEKICPYLVQSMLSLGHVAEAAALIARYWAERPDSIPLLTSYADVAVRQGDNQRARLLLGKVLEKEPDAYGPSLNLAKILWTAGEHAAAVERLRRVADVYSGDIPSRALLGEYYLRQSDPHSAIAPLEQAIRGASPHTAVTASLTSMLGAAYLQEGAAAAGQGRYGEAVLDYDQSIRAAPEVPAVYAYKAEACLRLKQFREAAAALRKLAALQPEDPAVFISLGDVASQAGDLAEAKRDWEKALLLVRAGPSALRTALEQRLAGHVPAATFP